MNPNDPNDQNSNTPSSSPFDASQAFAPTSSDSSSWTPPSVGGSQPQETPPPVMPSMPQDTNPASTADTHPAWAPPTDLSQSAQDSSPAAPTSNPFLSAGEPSSSEGEGFPSSAGEPSSSPTPDTGYASPESQPIEPTPTFITQGEPMLITQGQESLGVDTSSTPFQPTPPSAMDNQSGFMPSAQPQDTTSEAAHPELSEPAPTDLSQLAETPTPPPSAEIYTPPVLNPDSLVVPPNTNGVPETISQDEDSSHHIPKIAIIGAVIVILVVAAASAYFILGIGQQFGSSATPDTEQAPLTNPPSQTSTQPQTISTPVPTPTADSDEASSSFGDINGDTSATDQTPSATIGPSAIDQIKARQTTSASPTPVPN